MIRKLTSTDIEQALIVGRSVGLSGSMKFFEATAAELNNRLDPTKQITEKQVLHILDHIYFDDSLGRGELGNRHGALLRNYLMPGWLQDIAKKFVVQLKALYEQE
jgi:hypothetical protein